jgi:hypothetical protein
MRTEPNRLNLRMPRSRQKRATRPQSIWIGSSATLMGFDSRSISDFRQQFNPPKNQKPENRNILKS